MQIKNLSNKTELLDLTKLEILHEHFENPRPDKQLLSHSIKILYKLNQTWNKHTRYCALYPNKISANCV